MKSAEDYGYKEGDLFVIDSNEYTTLPLGTLIQLGKDDGTYNPYFYQITEKGREIRGSSGFDLCIGFNSLMPLNIPPEEVDQFIAEVKLKELIGAV